MMLESIENGPLVYLTIEENGQIRNKRYAELTEQEQLQDDCDVQETNIVLQGLPLDVYSLVNHCQSTKDIWDRSNSAQYPQQLSLIPQTTHSSLPYSPTYEAPHHPQPYQQGFQTQLNHTPPPVPQNTYHNPSISQLQATFPQLDSGLAVPSFLPATIQDGRVTVQQVQGRHDQSFTGMGNMEMLCALREILLHVKQGLLSVIIVRAQEASQVLDEEKLAFLGDPRVADVQVTQITIPLNVAFQTDDLDAYDSDYDDISLAKAVLMANLSSYDSDILFEDKVNQETKIVNESLTAQFERYKERVKTFEQRLNIDLSICEKLINSQMDDMIWKKNALKQEIDSLKQTLSKQVKEKESLLQTFTVFKKESKEKENKYMDKEIALENNIKELDNIVYIVGQSAQTVHMLLKPQVIYDDTHKIALGYQNLFYLKKDQRIKPTL
ncbi:hypothetical protein Tco_0489339 [Tanacetum coccineum]